MGYFDSRAWQYASYNNFGFRIHYDKIFKPEYLPSRIRYNAFFFWAILGAFMFKFRPLVSY